MMKDQKNKVELIGVYGGDETHALSAWTSTSRDLPEEKRARIPEFLKELAKSGHHSVFEKSAIHFLATTEIASHIHLLKHRVALSINSESARYKELNEDKHYIPVDWPIEEQNRYLSFVENSYKEYHECIERLVSSGFNRKRESARFYLPYGMQYTIDLMFNFRSFQHFIKLRYSKHAQFEIRQLAHQMLELVWDTHQFDASMVAFGFVKSDGTICDPFE
jgi:thymidylate synthase (FAD)